jgi:hypothetical protein
MANFVLVGAGGNGGNGVVGANSTAAGGGGGGSGSQSILTIPLEFLPDILYINLLKSNSGGFTSRIAVFPNTVANDCLLAANSGSNGGNAAGATAGTAGAGNGATTLAVNPLAGAGTSLFIAGQSGIAGGTVAAGAALTIPVTGLYVTGGTGGAGLGAAGVAGTAGGAFTIAGNFLAPHIGGIGGTAATTPPTDGSHGITWRKGLRYNFGGTGGGSTHGTATGAGLVGAMGGLGGLGCGGGGGGGALTGSTQGLGGQGGPAYCVITCW